MQLFVYGSLLRGMSLSSHMKGCRFIGPAWVHADLFFLGFYPGIIPGNQLVFGELYEVPDKVLPGIDEVEEYYEENPEDSVYIRKPIIATRFADAARVEAFAYYYNRENSDKQRISCGDYRRFMQLQKSEEMWLVGFGSNLSSQIIHHKIGEVPENKIVRITGFESHFNVRTGVNGFARPSLIYKGTRKSMVLVAWKLTYDQFEKLDIEENVPNLYYRVSLPVIDALGKQSIALTYMPNTSRLGSNLHPEPHYLEIQAKGMREHGLK
jgi:gamma-glutamylcyclotransferase (GGCT)/AIG2-like uncharacterized protein YtfP